MRAGVVAHCAEAKLLVHDGVHQITNLDVSACADLVKVRSQHLRAAVNFSDNGLSVGIIKPANVSDLSASFSVEGSAVEYHFSFLPSVQLAKRWRACLENPTNDATCRLKDFITFELCLRKIQI